MNTAQTINIITQESNSLFSRLEYTIDFIDNHPLKPIGLQVKLCNAPLATGINLYYGKEKESNIPAQNYFFSKNVLEKHIYLNPYKLKDKVLYAVELEKQEKQEFVSEMKFSFDVFETIFFHISRFEEVFTNENLIGQAGWLEESNHILVKSLIQETPVVDEIIGSFFEYILKVPIVLNSSYSLSHDVDILTRFSPPHKFLRSLLASLLVRKDLNEVKKSIGYYHKMITHDLPDPYNNFNSLLSQKFTLQKKTLYLMVGGNSKYDNKYKITDSLINEILKLAEENSYSVGLHPSYNTMSNRRRHQDEKKTLEKILGKNITQNRQHWLRWNWEVTPYVIQESGFTFDSSMGYNKYLGFRCGTGYSYHMYDFRNEIKFAWKEIPLSFMESSAIHSAKKKKTSVSENMVAFFEANTYNTHIEMNFHNSNFDPTLQTGLEIQDFYFNQLKSLIE